MTWSPATRAVSLGRPTGPGAPLNQPPLLASTFHDGGAGYARFGTDSHAAFEAVLGALEGGVAVAFSSGMAAAAAIIEAQPVGVTVVTSGNIYHGVRTLLADLTESGRLTDVSVDATDHGAVAAALDAATADGAPALLWIETPSNPLIQVLDVEALAAIAAERGVATAVDSTFATPLRLNPLALGATYAVHSATK